MSEMSGTEQKSSNVVWHEAAVTRQNREKLNGHRGAALWFTGLSSPHEVPEAAEIVVNTGELSLQESAEQVIDYLQHHRE